MKHKRFANTNKQYDGGSAAPANTSFVGNIFKGFLFEVLVGILLVFISAAAVYQSSDPDSISVPASLIALYLTAFFGGSITARINGNAALICGAINSLLLIFLIFSVSFTVPPFPYKTFSTGINLLLHFLIIPSSILGAYIGGKKRGKVGNSKKRKKRR